MQQRYKEDLFVWQDNLSQFQNLIKQQKHTQILHQTFQLAVLGHFMIFGQPILLQQESTQCIKIHSKHCMFDDDDQGEQIYEFGPSCPIYSLCSHDFYFFLFISPASSLPSSFIDPSILHHTFVPIALPVIILRVQKAICLNGNDSSIH